jgi:hypothetical protein
MSMSIECEISLGELIDKISILKIKLKNIQDQNKLIHVKKEEATLMEKLSSLGLENVDFHLDQLIEVNSLLWKIEDDIRELERQKRFDDEFIKLARAVYVTNDERFRRKNTINSLYNSSLVEVKSYKEY